MFYFETKLPIIVKEVYVNKSFTCNLGVFITHCDFGRDANKLIPNNRGVVWN